MSFIFRFFSYHMRVHPLRTNLCSSTTIGFCGDVICQTVYEPWSECRPPLTREYLPTESASSPFLREVASPVLLCRSKYWAWRAEVEGAVQVAPLPTTVLVDFRRSMIFCSFTFMFGVPYFLWVYRKLDAIIPPIAITKRQAIVKGFLSFIAAQVTNPIFLSYVTCMDLFFIYRDGRDGRRRVMEMSPAAPTVNHFLVTSEDGYADRALLGGATARSPSADGLLKSKLLSYFSFLNGDPGTMTVDKMDHRYRFVDDDSFNVHQFLACMETDIGHKLRHDFPAMFCYGFVFWGVNWLPMFYYIPSHLRLAYSAGMQVVWSGIMSQLMHRQHEGDVDARPILVTAPEGIEFNTTGRGKVSGFDD